MEIRIQAEYAGRDKMKKLKHALFITPTLILILCFGIIAVSFHIAMQRYLETLVSGEIGLALKAFEELYAGIRLSQEEPQKQDIFVIANNMILDKNLDLNFPKPSQYAPDEVQSAYEIAEYYKSQPHLLKEEEILKARVRGNTYFLKVKRYFGLFRDSYIQQIPLSEEDKTVLLTSGRRDHPGASDYYVMVYCDVSAILDLLFLLNRILFVILIGGAVFSIFLILHRARTVDRSFQRLKSFILQVGAREQHHQNLSTDEDDFFPLDYLEFIELKECVIRMDKMISQSEKTQIQFFQNASHELRTPLMSIQGYAEGVRENVIADRTKAMDIIVQEVRKMSELVDEMLTLSKLSMTKQKCKPVTLQELQELIHECAQGLHGALIKRGIRLIFSDFKGKHLKIDADEKMLQREFENILSNALRYAKTQIAIDCSISDQWVEISISDDGERI